MAIEPLYFVALHKPYQDERDPQPVNCTLVDARSLLHPDVPQPDGGRIYRCVVEAPDRTCGQIVPLSTVTFELGGGRLWPQVADCEPVVEAISRLARDGHCDSLRLGLPQPDRSLLAGGPRTTCTMHTPEGEALTFGPEDRKAALADLAAYLQRFVAEGGPLWSGDGLCARPIEPTAMPYEPLR